MPNTQYETLGTEFWRRYFKAEEKEQLLMLQNTIIPTMFDIQIEKTKEGEIAHVKIHVTYLRFCLQDALSAHSQTKKALNA